MFNQQLAENYQKAAAVDAATAMPVILENGRKVFGPPPDYAAARPTYMCELYVTHIPKDLEELGFLIWLHRIGRVYEFRLMMDTGNATRGYAFIRFCNEADALACYELLKHLYVGQDRLCVFRSQGKNRLFVSGIPRQIPLNLLEDSFKLCFPQMQSCTAYAATKQNKLLFGRDLEQNRGFAFIEFNDHEMALEAKKRLTPGRVRMWGVDLKVQWARPREELQQAAAGVKKQNPYYGNKINTYPFAPNDYCAKLRLYCLANNLSIPIVLYGQSFRPYQLQYAGILLKNINTDAYSMYIFEVMVARMSDIHLVMCELAVKHFERQCGQLKQHALFRVLNDTQAELVVTFQRPEQLLYLNMQNTFISYKSIKLLASSLELLAKQSMEKLLTLYKQSFLTRDSLAKFELDGRSAFGCFYSILPTFRNNDKLNNNFNDTEIVLLQAYIVGRAEEDAKCDGAKSEIYQFNRTFVRNYQDPKHVENIFLKSQHGYGIKYILRYVDLMSLQSRECYHPLQRANCNPIWIAGQSYQKSIYK